MAKETLGNKALDLGEVVCDFVAGQLEDLVLIGQELAGELHSRADAFEVLAQTEHPVPFLPSSEGIIPGSSMEKAAFCHLGGWAVDAAVWAPRAMKSTAEYGTRACQIGKWLITSR